MVEGPQLAALVSSKVCHDMVEPMSAIIQGLEMLKEAEGGKGANADALSLLDHGVTKAWAKLEFFRFAFAGALADGEGELEEAREVANKLYGALKPDLAWKAGSAVMPRQAVRVVVNLLMIANECLPRGGVVEITTGSEGGAGEVRVLAAGPRAALRPATAAALRGEPPENGYHGHTVQPMLTGILARQAGVELLAREGEERVELVARSAAFKV